MADSGTLIGVLIEDPADRCRLAGLLDEEGYRVEAPEPDAWASRSWAEVEVIITAPPAAGRLRRELLAIRHDRSMGLVPLVVVLPPQADAEGWLNAGFDDVLRRPVTKAELASRLRTLVRLSSEASSHWRGLFGAIDHPAFVVGPDFKVLAVNRALVQASGLSNKELVGRRCWDVLHAPGGTERPRDCPLYGASWQDDPPRGLGSPRVLHVKAWGRHYQVSCTPIVDGEGRLRRTVHVATDITESVRTEEALRVSEARFRAIFEGATEGILSADPETLVFVQGNPAICAMLGYTPDEIAKLRVYDIHPADSLSHVLDQFERQRRGEITCAPDLPVLRKDGSVFLADISAFAVTMGDRDYMIGFFRDVTERKRAAEERETLETRLRQAQKMEAVGRLAGGVAHDFNNILTAIVGNVDLAGSMLEADGVEAGSLEEPLRQIAAAAERAAALTRQLLAFSRREIASPKEVDLNTMLRDMARMFAPALTEQVDLSLVCDPKLRKTAIDPCLLEQVVVNLLLNARDAMPEGGRVCLETSNVEIDGTRSERPVSLRPGSHVKLEVRDNGCGMDAETVERIFEPFFTTKEMGRGTGLGLATVYGIIKQAGGHVVVESEPGRGTCFAIYLPAISCEAAPLPPEPVPGEPVRLGTETILLCEDDDIVRDLTARMLRSGGYRVLCAEGGAKALRQIGQARDEINLVVTDVIMADINGKQLADRIMAIRPDLQVLYTSGYPDDVIGECGILPDKIEFLAKPFTRAELLSRVCKLLEAARV